MLRCRGAMVLFFSSNWMCVSLPEHKFDCSGDLNRLFRDLESLEELLELNEVLEAKKFKIGKEKFLFKLAEKM